MAKVKPILLSFFGFILFVLTLCTLRTYFFLEKSDLEGFDKSDRIEINDESWKRFAQSIKIPTVSWSAGVYNETAADDFVKYFIYAYRSLFTVHYVDYEIINKRSILITVKGSDVASLPYLLMGHYDVVPAERSMWSMNPFSAEIRNDRMYGRGTIDCKLIVNGILEALYELVQRGEQPKKNLFIAFGHDEEVGGHDGAAYVAEALKKRGIKKLEFVLDEGMPVTRGMIPGVKHDVALIGVAEKGHMSVNISVTKQPGHSSMPSGETSIGIVAKAIQKLEAKPLPARMDKVTRAVFESIGQQMKFPLNVIFTNFWLFESLILTVLKWKPDTASMVRTTTAVTMIGGGTKTNVLPSHAWAAVNFRIHPMSTVNDVLQSIKSIIDDDRVRVKTISGFDTMEPAPISPHDSSRDLPYKLIHKTVMQIHDNVLSAPGTMIANTDTKYYHEFTEHIFRHFPIVLTRKDIATIHGHNENVSKQNFARAIQFYYQLMKNADKEDFSKTQEDWSIKNEL